MILKTIRHRYHSHSSGGWDWAVMSNIFQMITLHCRLAYLIVPRTQ